MFQKILAVLDPAQPCHCVLNTAFSYAKAHHALLRVITSAKDEALLQDNDLYIDIAQLVEQTDQALIEAALLWEADLIVMARALDADLQQALPCSILIVRQDDRTISITMQLKPPSLDLKARNRLERLFDLTQRL